MNKYIFIKEVDKDNQYDLSKITFETEAEKLTELLEELELFIKAAGFNPKGILTFEELD